MTPRDEVDRTDPERTPGDGPSVTSPFVIERLLRAAYLTFGRLGLPAERELEQDKELWERRRLDSLQRSAQERAQELAFQAWESAEESLASTRAREALALDPRCVDALVVQALTSAQDAEDLLAQLEHAARVAEDELGDEFFAEFMGDLWAEVIARPYLRALCKLASAQWAAGRRLDAVATLENLLELDQPDHLNVAALLLAWYLEFGERQRAHEILEAYGEDENPVFGWAETLLAYLDGDQDAAAAALARARRFDPDALPYLTGVREPPPRTDACACRSPSGNTAGAAGRILAPAWAAHAPAMLWLLQRDACDDTGEGAGDR
jgi:hypothetical protein